MSESVLEYLLPIGMLVFGLAVLLFSAERLVGAAEASGIALGIPPFLVGITVLAVGTSLPELVTAMFALHGGNGEIVVGTAIGSNIANILLVMGCAALCAKEAKLGWDLLHGDLPVLLGSVMLVAFFIYPVSMDDLRIFSGTDAAGSKKSLITTSEGLILLLGYVLYLNYYISQKFGASTAEKQSISFLTICWILAGLVGVPIGAYYTVQAGVTLAEKMVVGKEVVAASMISVGTSLPELVVSYSAVRRKNYEMALGNITGSNIFNTFVVIGLPALFAPFIGSGQTLGVGDHSILFIQMPFYIGAAITFLVVVLDKKITRTEGFLFVLCYAVFISKLYNFI